MALSSIDYSDLLRDVAYSRYSVNLNKTQVNKLLFMCYGFYLALTGERLFEEHPKAWPYGPVFPNVYKAYGIRPLPISISPSKREELAKDKTAINIVEQVVRRYCHTSAYELSMWSHEQGGPWHQTVFGVSGDENTGWNKEIKDELIKAYFAQGKDGE